MMPINTSADDTIQREREIGTRALETRNTRAFENERSDSVVREKKIIYFGRRKNKQHF